MDKLKTTVKNYGLATLEKHQLALDPLVQFKAWLDDAFAKEPREPNAMTLATVDKQGHPSARLMLLKEVNEKGFVFYTNYESRKGHELDANQWAALVFWWPYCERQVRVEGYVEKSSKEASDAYFASRSKESRLGALASKQSSVIENREVLDQAYQDLEERFADTVIIPRPENWGGYCLKPTTIEFWQGGPHRLHDRFRYKLQTESDKSWKIDRLSP